MTGPTHVNSSSGTPASALPFFDRVLFYILLATLCARPLISETFEPVQVSFLTALQVTGGPTPATTATLDSLLLATATLTLVRRQRGRAAPFLALGIGLLATAVLLSAAAADDKPVALLAGCNLLILVLAGAALAALVRTRWMLHLLLAALLASGVTTAIKCLNQRIHENPQTQEQWETVYKPELIRQGLDPQDPLFINFERRMHANESYGFLGHPNVTASCLLMWGLVAAGVLVGRIRRPSLRANSEGAPIRLFRLIAGALLVGLLAAALVFTDSRGADVSAAGAILGLVLLGFAAPWVARHARAVLALLLGGYLAFFAGIIGYGVLNGTLPHPSLAFRWYYWTAAGRALEEVPLTGLGRENFGAAYMRYKVAESTEEVRNPHSLWVSLLVELGPLGLLAGLLLCARCLWRALRSLAPAPPRTPAPEPLTAARAAPAAIAFLLIHVLFSGTAFGAPGVGLVCVQEIAVTWLLALVVSAWLFADFLADARRTAWVAAGLCAALLGVLLHSILDFALLTPGGLSVFVLASVAAAALLRANHPWPVETPARTTWSRTIPALAGVVLVAGHCFAVAVPARATARAFQRLDAALHALRTGGDPANVSAAAAQLVNSNTRDSSAARAAARALTQVARLPGLADDQRRRWFEQARTAAAEACRRSPHDTSNFTTLATTDDELARLGAPADARAELQRAAETWDRAVALYPTNPRTRISAGRAWFELWRQTASTDAASRARQHLLAALRIDDTRPAQEVVRLRPAERAEAESLLQRLPPEP